MHRFLLMLLLAGFLAGCKTRYDITLNNGLKISGVSKPVLDPAKGEYRFKYSNGKEGSVKDMRVRVIEPHGDSDDSKFNAPPGKR